MKKLVLGALVATLAGAFVAPSHAAPPPGGPVGLKCAFNSTTDVTREAGWQTGDVRVGPLVTGESGTAHCKFIVNSNAHNSTQVRADVAFPDTADLAVVGATTLNYQATAADDIAVCTSWDPDAAGAPTLYWVPAAQPSQIPPSIPPSTNPADYQGHWSTNAADPCGVATSIEPNDPECSIWKALDSHLGTNIAEIWQDCEPYDEFPLPI